ncbi:MAG: hypothetical protein AAFX87_16650 [Bacteroidota bacterium]
MVVIRETINGNTISLDINKGLCEAKVKDETGHPIIVFKTLHKVEAWNYFETVADILAMKSMHAN